MCGDGSCVPPPPNPPNLQVRVSGDGSCVAALATDGSAQFFDVDKGKELWKLKLDYKVNCVAVSHDGGYTVAGSQDSRSWGEGRGRGGGANSDAALMVAGSQGGQGGGPKGGGGEGAAVCCSWAHLNPYY